MSKVANSRSQSLKIYPIAIALGAAVGLVSIGFLVLVIFLQHLIWRPTHFQLSPTVVLILCTVGGLLVGLLNQASERDRVNAHDLSEAISDMEDVTTNQPPSGKVIFGRAALGIVSLGFGGPLGPEAPVIALVSQLSSRLAGTIRMARDRAVELSVAGSLGALFGVPIVLTGLEDDSKKDDKSAVEKLAARGPEILAAISSFVVITKLLPGAGISVYHTKTASNIGFGLGLLWVAVIAVLASALGRALAITLPPIREYFVKNIPGGAVPIGIASGLVLGASSFISPLILFSGHHEIQDMLDRNYGGFQLIVLALLKLFVVVVCLAGGWYGGQIFPLAFIGAAIGLAVNQFTHSSAPLTFAAAGFVAASAVGLRKPMLALLLGILLFPKETWIPMLLATVIAIATTENTATHTGKK
ncbi:MAG: chloride channel protein [Actinomycetes bacterium]